MTATATTTTDPRAFTRMTQQQLDEMFTQSTSGPIPSGDSQGTAIVMPGSFVSPIAAALARALFWKGKVFDPSTHELRNKLTPFAIRLIRANVYRGASWLDGKEAIVLDYSKTSFVAGKIRDEIREVAPGVYLGKVWWGKRRIADFALQV
jgi:hypothetical protein